VCSSDLQVRITTAARGIAATLFIPATVVVNGTIYTNTAAAILGLPVNRHWRGKNVVPGWSVVNDPNTLSDRPTRLIVFDRPLKGFTDFVELNYTTVRQECRRCGGLGIENDWRYDGSGQVVKVQGYDLLLQEVKKITYTVLGSNTFFPWYGTNIIDSIGRKLSSSGISQNLILSEVSDAFRRWQSIKRQQEEKVGQLVTDEEYPFRLSAVNLQQSDQDPTIILVNCVVQSRSNKPITITREVKTPLPIDLLGSTQQRELFDQTLPNYQLVK
jgi:hypothetical protein